MTFEKEVVMLGRTSEEIQKSSSRALVVVKPQYQHVSLKSPFSRVKAAWCLLAAEAVVLSIFDPEIMERYNAAGEAIDAGDEKYDLNKIFNKNL